jgi:protein-tyrosine phosphatase
MMSRYSKARQSDVVVALLFVVLLSTGCASSPERGARFYELEGARNFRDFGGYVTEDGEQVLWGKLFRSNQPAGMTSADYSEVASLQLATVVDFRTAEEREAAQTEWQGNPAPQFVLLPMGSTEAFVELDAQVAAAIEAEDIDALRKAAVEVYRRMPIEYAGELGVLLRSLASDQSLPIMMHCHAGKDRTGLSAALILSLLGVSRETIMADYLYSNDRMLSDGVERTAIEKVYWGVEEDWLRASFEGIEAHYGSLDRYFEVALGIDAATRARIRKNLVQ